MKTASILSILLLLAGVCFGYSWRETPSITKEIGEADAVCIVRVTSHHDLLGADGLIEATRFKLTVIGEIKGTKQNDISVLCPNDSGRFVMEDGHTYLIFAKKRATDDMYFIDATGNSQELKNGK